MPPAGPVVYAWAYEESPRMASDHSHPIGNHELRRVAVAALVDPRTVVHYLRGDRQHEHMRLRIEQGLRTCGLDRYVRPRRDLERRDSTPPPSAV